MLGVDVIIAFGLAGLAFVLARARAVRVADGQLSRLHSRPNYHGLYAMLWTGLAAGGALILAGVGSEFWMTRTLIAEIEAALPDALGIEHQRILSDAGAIARGGIVAAVDPLREAIAVRLAGMQAVATWLTLAATLGAGLIAGATTLARVQANFRARNRAEKFIRGILLASAAVAVLTTIGIVLSLIFETLSFFSNIGWRIDKFLFGTRWSPLSGVQDGVLDPDKVGAAPLFVGTFLVTGIAMAVAVPIGLFAAIFLSEFASLSFRAKAKPMLEILAGVPTVVYGFFAAITVAPHIRGWGEALGLDVASESALAAGLVMGIMIIPFISSLSDDVINAVPQALRDGSYGLGATRAETIRQVVLPAALPGIVSAVLLGVSRAVGETMIVVMAAGQGANLTVNPMEAVTTVTVQIVMLITGDTEAKVAAGPAFALGFTLFCVTLILNIIALRVVKKYREAYE